MHEQGYVSPVITAGESSSNPNIKAYKHGMVQPGILRNNAIWIIQFCVAVLNITKEKKVLFSWAIDPNTVRINIIYCNTL